MANDLIAAKRDQRKHVKSLLSGLSSEKISSQSQKAQSLIMSMPQYKTAQRLSIYLSMPAKEAQTTALVQDSLEQGKKVFVPYIHQPSDSKRKVIDMLHLRSLDEFSALKADSWGIPTLPRDTLNQRENAMGGSGLGSGEMLEPTENGEGREDGTLDLIVMPGVAFDEGMNRLGHGGGFYDGFLSRYCSDGTKKPFLVGLCLAKQMLPSGEEIPTTYDDWIVDAVAVGDERLLTLDT